jgi:hypothetical protein
VTTVDAATLIGQISPPMDQLLSESLIKEFLDLERRFVLGDWEPATLNGGQFAEIAARIIYHIDFGTANRRKELDKCLSYVEDENNANQHAFPHRRTALHLCRVLRTIYKFRSQRGAVHIDPDYTANEMDSTLIMSLSRWTMAELLRVFWTGPKADIAQVIREIVRFEVPAILVIDSKPLVLRTDCSVEEEVLLLLHNAGEKGMTRTLIGQSVPKSAPQVTTALQKLIHPSARQAAKRNDGTYILTPNGVKRVMNELSNKLTLT